MWACQMCKVACAHLLWPLPDCDVWKPPCLSTIIKIVVCWGQALRKQHVTDILPFLVFSHSTVCLILLFSQYLSKVDVPLIAYKDKKWTVFQYPLFKLFSVSCQHYPKNFAISHPANPVCKIKDRFLIKSDGLALCRITLVCSKEGQLHFLFNSMF